MATLTDVRKALALQLREQLPWSKNTYWFGLAADTAKPLPRLSIEVRSVTNQMSQDGSPDAVLVIVIEPDGSSEEDVAIKMDRYLDRVGDESVFAAIDTDPTLGGLVAHINPRSGDVDLFRAEIECRVMFL